MKCPKCRFENPEDAKFCIECGDSMEFHFPKCGTETPATGKYCKECGHNLRELKRIPSIDYSKPQSYTPKFLAHKILTTRSSMEGERKLVTVLFADVANCTTMTEKLDPEEIQQVMDHCFKILMDVIHKYEGTINQFTGDGVMALFGAPVAHENHAQRACYAALSIQKAIDDYRAKIKKDYGADFKMRIGLNSGPVIGREFAFRVLRVILNHEEELRQHLQSLQSLEFIYEKPIFPELEYIFKHALTQEVAYNSLLLKKRKEFHRRIGEAIEELYAETLPEHLGPLAFHFYQAEDGLPHQNQYY